MAILLELRVIPIATPTTSLSRYIAEAIKIIEKHSARYILTPFGTCIEIENFETLAEILKEIAERSKTEGIKRLVIDVSLDIRFDKQISLESKVRSVEEKLR